MLLNMSLVLSLFGNFFIDIEDSRQVDKYTTLVNKFVTKGLLIGVSSEAKLELSSQQGNVLPRQKIIMRPNIFSNDRTWNISFYDQRIDISWNTHSKDLHISEDDFIKKSKEYLDIIIESYKLKFNRIALNREDVLLDVQQIDIDTIVSRIADIKISSYQNNNIEEWGFRFLRKEQDDNLSKKINVILNVNRGINVFPWAPNMDIDCITTHYDINTEYSKDTSQTIPIDKVPVFLEKYKKIRSSISEEIWGDLNEEY